MPKISIKLKKIKDKKVTLFNETFTMLDLLLSFNSDSA